jgi:hypothetical protein
MVLQQSTGLLQQVDTTSVEPIHINASGAATMMERSSASCSRRDGNLLICALLIAACMLAHACQVDGRVLSNSSDVNSINHGRHLLGAATLKRIADHNVYTRAWTSVLDRLSIGNFGGQIYGVADLQPAISGRCQTQTWVGGCSDEALELQVWRQGDVWLNFK